MAFILETERTSVRQLNMEDGNFIIRLLNSPAWLEFIGDRNIKTNEDAEKYLTEGPIKSYAVNGFGLCLVELKQKKIPIGICGIIKRDFLDYPDLGFAFLPEYIGSGYGYESAVGMIHYARETLRIKEMLAITALHNERSIALLLKIGFEQVKNIQWKEGGEESKLFRLR